MKRKRAVDMNEAEVLEILQSTAKIFTGMETICVLSLFLILIEDIIGNVPCSRSREGLCNWLIEEMTQKKEFFAQWEKDSSELEEQIKSRMKRKKKNA